MVLKIGLWIGYVGEGCWMMVIGEDGGVWGGIEFSALCEIGWFSVFTTLKSSWISEDYMR
jgi:hypothetical protein